MSMFGFKSAGEDCPLPDFLVIGVPRAGTTWLHRALARHPAIYVPGRRKEIHFYDRHFDRGTRWYARYFRGGRQYPVVGEVTPHYLYVPDLAVKLRSTPSVTRLVVVLRDPVDRAVSHYRWRMRHDGYRGSFGEFLDDYPEALDWGRYVSHLERLGEWIESGRLLVLRFERLFTSGNRELSRLAEFLGVPEEGFSGVSEEKQVNPGHVPRYPGIARFASGCARALRAVGFDRPVNLGKRLRLDQLAYAGSNDPGPVPDGETLAHLHQLYEGEIERLEALLQQSFDPWRRNVRDPEMAAGGRKNNRVKK